MMRGWNTSADLHKQVVFWFLHLLVLLFHSLCLLLISWIFLLTLLIFSYLKCSTVTIIEQRWVIQVNLAYVVIDFQFIHPIILLTGFLVLFWGFRPWGLKKRCIAEVHKPFVVLNLKIRFVLLLKIHSTVENLLFLVSIIALVIHVKTHSWSFDVIFLNLERELILRLINNWSICGYVGLKYFLPCFIQ